MTHIALLTHLLFGFALFLLSAGICCYLARHPIIMDIPNQRSSHDTPIPKSGGLAIVATFMAGVAAIYFLADVAVIKDYFFLGFVILFFFSFFIINIDSFWNRFFYLSLSRDQLHDIRIAKNKTGDC